MDSWWELGEGIGFQGVTLAIHSIECPFCNETGNFSVVHHEEKKKPNHPKILNFDTLKCGNCAGFVMVLWSSSRVGMDGLHDYRVLPWSLKLNRYPEEYPDEVGRCWLQAHRSLQDENWDAASVMARSALQAALRDNQAQGRTLRDEIEDLASKGILPPLMKDWSDNVRDLGNISAHPQPGQPPTDPNDAKDIVQFLDFLLIYLYKLPKKIQDYRSRRENQQ
jgi:hypothetical protein